MRNNLSQSDGIFIRIIADLWIIGRCNAYICTVLWRCYENVYMGTFSENEESYAQFVVFCCGHLGLQLCKGYTEVHCRIQILWAIHFAPMHSLITFKIQPTVGSRQYHLCKMSNMYRYNFPKSKYSKTKVPWNLNYKKCLSNQMVWCATLMKVQFISKNLSVFVFN